MRNSEISFKTILFLIVSAFITIAMTEICKYIFVPSPTTVVIPDPIDIKYPPEEQRQQEQEREERKIKDEELKKEMEELKKKLEEIKEIEDGERINRKNGYDDTPWNNGYQNLPNSNIIINPTGCWQSTTGKRFITLETSDGMIIGGLTNGQVQNAFATYKLNVYYSNGLFYFVMDKNNIVVTNHTGGIIANWFRSC